MTTGKDDPVRVVIADDEPDIRVLVGHLLRRRNGWEVVGEAADGAAAIEQARLHQPDIVVLDLAMPVQRGDDALPHLLAVAPSCMVAIFSAAEPTPDRHERLLRLGAFSFHPKTASDGLAEELARDYERFKRALSGEDTVPTWLVHEVAEARRAVQEAASPDPLCGP